MPAPEIRRQADLGALSTFALPARTSELVEIRHPEQIPKLPRSEAAELWLGGGSNTVFLGDFPGRIVLNRITGVSFKSNGDRVEVTAAAGENWHALVRRCLDAGLHGLENLIMIPGSVGAAPMQNIGAYGMELSEVFSRLRAWDRDKGEFVTLNREACRFGYRDSRFKSGDPGRFVITSVSLQLSRQFQPRTGYASLADELERAGMDHPSPRQLAAAIMRLRRHRLPDPGRLPNAGSFFRNPVVSAAAAEPLLHEHAGLPHWTLPDGRVKLGAASMIETLGWKGRFIGDAGVFPRHALVLVNRGHATGDQLGRLINAIVGSVEREFGIRLEPEPRVIDPHRCLATATG